MAASTPEVKTGWRAAPFELPGIDVVLKLLFDDLHQPLSRELVRQQFCALL